MTQTNPILPEVRAGTVSREALVQAALKEITQNYREASLSNVAREYGVSLAYVSECVRAQTDAPIRNCCKSTVWRPLPACCAAAT